MPVVAVVLAQFCIGLGLDLSASSKTFVMLNFQLLASGTVQIIDDNLGPSDLLAVEGLMLMA